MPTKNPYSFKAKVVKRSNGKSAVAGAAYQAGEKLIDERTGRRCNYSRKKGVVHSEILAPQNSPAWAMNRGPLWNSAERAENRKDAQTARKFILALPKELTHEQRQKYARKFIQEQFVARGMVADFSIHLPDAGKNQDNHHLHLMLTMRNIGLAGFGKKNRDWNKVSLLETWREQWAVYTNHALEAQGFEPTWDHRTLEEQGIKRVPQIHLGQAVLEMEARGIKTERAERALEIHQANLQIEELKQVEKEIRDERLGESRKSPQLPSTNRSTGTATPAGKPANQLPTKSNPGHEPNSEKASAPAQPAKTKISRPATGPVSPPQTEGEPDMNLSPAEQQEFLRVRRRIAAQQQAETEARQRQLSEEQKQRFLELEAIAEEAEHTRKDQRFLDHYFAWGCMDELRQQKQTVETADWKETEGKVAANLLANGANVTDVASLVFDLGLSATGSPIPPANAVEHLKNLALNRPDLADAMRVAERREKEEEQQNRQSDEDGEKTHSKQSFPQLPGA